MATDRVNREDGISGQKLRLVFADTHSDLSLGVESTAALIENDVVAVIGPEDAELSQRIASKLSASGILFFSPFVSAESAPGVSDASPWFRLSQGPASLGKVLAAAMLSRGKTHCILVSGDDAYNTEFATGFRLQFESLGGSVEKSVVIAQQKGSYGKVISDIGLDNLDNVVLSASHELAARFVNDVTTLREGASTQWFLSPVLKTDAFIQNTVVGTLEGALGVSPMVFEKDPDFVTEFRDRWSTDPTDGAYFYYDAVAVMALALQAGWYTSNGPPSISTLRESTLNVVAGNALLLHWDALAEGLEVIRRGQRVSYSGLTGYFHFQPDGSRKGPAKIWQVEHGRIVQ
jgi:ABC-type branched-subunit amino acid transport system substrate-binding protein